MPGDNPVLPSYMLQLPDPAEGIRKNLELALGVQHSQQLGQAAQDAHTIAQQTAQANSVAAQQAETERQNMLGFRQDFAANAANPTAGGNLALIKKYPQYVAQITGASKAISAEEAKQLLPIHAAGLTGARDVQADEIKKLAASYLNSKDPQQKAHGQSLMDGLKLQQSNPGAYDTMMGVKIADGIGGEEYGKVYGGVTKLPDEILKGKSDASAAALVALHKERELTDAHNTAVATANASNATTQEKQQAIDLGKKVAQFKVDQAKAESESAIANAIKAKRDAVGLSEVGSKQYGDAYKEVTSAAPAIAKATILAGKIRTDGLSGTPAVANKYWHQFTGSADQNARLNQEFSSISSSSILGDMSAVGRITPAELELFGKGVPTENQSGEDKAAWLDTYAKVMAFKRDQALAKVKHITANGDLTPMKRDTVIDGKLVKAGTPPPGLEAPAAVQSAGQGKPTPAQIQTARMHADDPKTDKATAASLRAWLKGWGA